MQGSAGRRVPRVEIVAIGTELVMGRVLDTNTHWMEGQIVALGGHVRRAVMVEDDRAEIITVLADSVRRRTDIVITTGGLGPTPDDLTAGCIAELVGAPLAPDEFTLDEYVRRRSLSGRDQITPNLVRMATVPVGARIYQNPVGWAPLINVETGEAPTRIWAMPGPPKEVEGVFTAHLAPVIARESGIHRLAERVSVDMWESEMAPLVAEVMRRFPGSYLKGYVAMRTNGIERLPVDIIVSHTDRAQAEATLHDAIALFEGLLRERGKTMRRG